jgi:hypothetical protein
MSNTPVYYTTGIRSLTAEQISELPDSEFEPNDFDNESVASYSSNGSTSTRGTR